jgi:hypothetical protein
MYDPKPTSQRSAGAGLRATIVTLAVACALTTIAGVSRTMDMAAGDPLRRPTAALPSASLALGLLA